MIEKRVKRYSLSRQVADQLEKMIEDGTYAVGEKIPTEPELTEMFSVSRNTLREAIQSLTSAGILVVKQGDGTYVRSNNRFHARMSMEYDQVSPADILEARNVLEITMAALASQRRTDEDLLRIGQALLLRQKQTDTEKENTQADMQFHLEVSKACHNKILMDLYASIASYTESQIAERQALTALGTAEIDALHEKLYLAIRDRQADTAQLCAQNILNI